MSCNFYYFNSNICTSLYVICLSPFCRLKHLITGGSKKVRRLDVLPRISALAATWRRFDTDVLVFHFTGLALASVLIRLASEFVYHIICNCEVPILC